MAAGLDTVELNLADRLPPPVTVIVSDWELPPRMRQHRDSILREADDAGGAGTVLVWAQTIESQHNATRLAEKQRHIRADRVDQSGGQRITSRIPNMINHGEAARIAKDIYHPRYHPRQAGA